VKTTQAGTLTNSATVSGNEADPNVANNSATATTTVNPAADLKLTKTANPSTAHLGQPLTYTITITNQGASAAQTLTMTDTWNKNAGFASVTTDGKGSCVAKPDKRTLTCNLSTLPSTAGSNVWTITLVLKPTSKPSVVNTASVTSSTPDPNTSNNSVTLTTPVSP
jgi:uncharacterized repeat protein (TIGR01451 family)